MPLDYRRFNGPEDSVPYMRYTKDYLKSYNELYSDLFDEKGARKDGRGMEDARSIKMLFARTDFVSQAKGSAYIEMKKTKVVCSVFDPREIPHQNEFSQLGNLYCEVKFAPFSCPRQRRPHAPDAEEKSLSNTLKQALEPVVCRHLFPNYQIDIFVYILEHDGACLAAAINAAGLALADAAVPMYDIITSTSAAIINNQILLDPTENEEHVASIATGDANHGVITMSVLSELKQVSNFNLVGSIDVDMVSKVSGLLEEECKKVVPYIQKVLVRNVVSLFEEKLVLDEEAERRERELNAKLEVWANELKDG